MFESGKSPWIRTLPFNVQLRSEKNKVMPSTTSYGIVNLIGRFLGEGESAKPFIVPFDREFPVYILVLLK